jgi:hypothetical protein
MGHSIGDGYIPTTHTREVVDREVNETVVRKTKEQFDDAVKDPEVQEYVSFRVKAGAIKPGDIFQLGEDGVARKVERE